METFNPVLNVPLAHALHERSDVALPLATTISPATQLRQELHADAFASVLKVPLAHAEHDRSADTEPDVVTYCPAGQALHAVQLAAFTLALNEPAAQFEHTRFVVASPSFCTNWPGMQIFFGTHAVAELPSSSQVPAGHAIFCAASPAHQVPASHGVHVTAEPELPEPVICVPGAHEPCDTHADRFGSDE